MRDIEKNVSLFVENLFPAVYREDAPFFINFVKAYYEWMESQNELLFHARRLTEYRDIDQVPDAFILFFKNKYLPDIQFTTATNKQLFIKNALDFYRSKGTPRSVDLYFKLVHGLEAQVYNPGQDLFRLSDNEYTNIKYLEVVPVPNIEKVVGRTIYGSHSLSEAFVDRIVRVKKDSRIMTILYIENVIGRFITAERFTTNDDVDENIGSLICGSLSEASIVSSDANFEVGERLYIVPTASDFGKQAVLQVSEITSYEGVVDFELLNPGYGYTLDILNENEEVILPGSEILGSERVLFIDDIKFTSDRYLYDNDYIGRFNIVKQPLVKFTYNSAAADDDFANKRQVTAYYPDSQISSISIEQNIPIDNITGSSGTAVVTTNNPHGLQTGDIVDISGATTGTGFNSTENVIEVTGPSTFTFDNNETTTEPSDSPAVAVASTVVTVDTTSNHNLSNGDYISIVGTNNYDGDYGPIVLVDTNTFTYRDSTANTAWPDETSTGNVSSVAFTGTVGLIEVSDITGTANVVVSYDQDKYSTTNLDQLYSVDISTIQITDPVEYVITVVASSDIFDETEGTLNWNLKNGDYITISGTTEYDGTFGPITLTGTRQIQIDQITGTGSVATVTTEDNHGLLSGDLVDISGATTGTGFNAISAEITVTGLTTFTYNNNETTTEPSDSPAIVSPVNQRTITFTNSSVNLSATQETQITSGLKWGRLYTSSNTDTGTLSLISDATASANVIAISQNCTITYTFSGTELVPGDIIKQKHTFFPTDYWGSTVGYSVDHANAVVTNTSIDTSTVPATYYADITLDTGAFRNDENALPVPMNTFERRSDGQSFTLTGISNTQAGVISVQRDFYSGNAYAEFYSLDIDTITGQVSDVLVTVPYHNFKLGSNIRISGTTNFDGGPFTVTNAINSTAFAYGDDTKNGLNESQVGEVSLQGTTFKIDTSTTYETPASFKISGLNEEVIIPDAWCQDLIQSVGMSTTIGSGSYPGVPTGINSPLNEVFDFYDITIGSIEEIITTNPGRNYASDPFFVVYETKVDHWSLEKYDYFVHYEKSTGESGNLNFKIGEAVVGQTSGTRGRIYAHDESNQRLDVTRLNPFTDFINEEIITAEETNLSAKITDVYENRRNMEHQLGLNANVSSVAFSGDGFITGLQVINSGYGYENNTDVTLASYDEYDKTAQVKIYFGYEGKSEGYFYNRKSFLSSDKYLQDSDYWQEYSYQVKTQLPYNNYKDVLKKVLHPAGTKSFGSYFATHKAQVAITSKVETSEFGLKIDQNLLNISEFFVHNVVFIIQPDLFDNSLNNEFGIQGDTTIVRLKRLEQDNIFFDADDLITFTHSIQHV